MKTYREILEAAKPKPLNKKEQSAAMKFLTKKFKLKPEDFDYVGFTDLTPIGSTDKLLQFNILKKGHEKYQSTVSFRYKGK